MFVKMPPPPTSEMTSTTRQVSDRPRNLPLWISDSSPPLPRTPDKPLPEKAPSLWHQRTRDQLYQHHRYFFNEPPVSSDPSMLVRDHFPKTHLVWKSPMVTIAWPLGARLDYHVAMYHKYSYLMVDYLTEAQRLGDSLSQAWAQKGFQALVYACQHAFEALRLASLSPSSKVREALGPLLARTLDFYRCVIQLR